MHRLWDIENLKVIERGHHGNIDECSIFDIMHLTQQGVRSSLGPL